MKIERYKREPWHASRVEYWCNVACCAITFGLSLVLFAKCVLQ